MMAPSGTKPFDSSLDTHVLGPATGQPDSQTENQPAISSPNNVVDDSVWEYNVVDYLKILNHYKWFLIVGSLLSGVVAGAYALTIAPVYRAEVIMLPTSAEDGKGGVGGIAGSLGGIVSLMGGDLGGNVSGKNEAIATLKSRAFTENFIVEENLVGVLTDEDRDVHDRGASIDEDYGPRRRRAALVKFDQLRQIVEDKKTGLITLTVDWTVPEMATVWANGLVAKVNESLRKRAINQAQKSIQYLNQELANTSVVELHKAIYGLIETQINKIMLANVRQEYAFKVVDPAVVPYDRIKPKRKQIVLTGVMGGFFVCILLCLLFHFRRKTKVSG